MSLIEEALRRVQDPLIPHQHVQAPPSTAKQKPRAEQTSPAHPWATTPPAPAPAAPPMVGINPLMAVAVAVLALTVVFVIGGAFWMGRTMARTESREAALTELTTPAEPKTQAPFPKPSPFKEIPVLSIPWVKNPPAPAPKEEFVLSGVIEGDGESYAVINGMIFGIGERVGKATVMEISNGSVRLLLGNGKETVLRVPY